MTRRRGEGGVPHKAGLLAGLLVAIVATWPASAQAHDPSQFGGLFRSRDGGATWTTAAPNRYLSTVLGLAVSPADGGHLLMATDSGLYRSRNGGLDWQVEAPDVVGGRVTAVAFDGGGRRAILSTDRALFRDDGAGRWARLHAPEAAAPARSLLTVGSRVYLAAGGGIFLSDDFGTTWSTTGGGRLQGPVTVLAAAPRPPATVWAVAGGRLWSTLDGRSWQARDAGLPARAVSAVLADPGGQSRVWAAAGDRVYRSVDGGRTWRQMGRPLPLGGTRIRGVAVAGGTLVLSTSSGLYRSADEGQDWQPLGGNLPAHLESAPLVADPADPGTWYAGFSIVPYEEVWRAPGGDRDAQGRLDIPGLAAGAGVLVLLGLLGALALRRLRRHYRCPAAHTQ